MCRHYLCSGCPQSKLLKDKAQLPHFPVVSRTGPPYQWGKLCRQEQMNHWEENH